LKANIPKSIPYHVLTYLQSLWESLKHCLQEGK
jgi:hypothetical protein